MITLTRSEIEALIDLPAAATAIEQAYRAASAGAVTLPPVGHIAFPSSADCHIKYGHMSGDPSFVIKIATGFPDNAALGLPTGNGLVVVMSAQTGTVEAVLHDEMMLTDLRTGLGGAIASRALACPDSTSALVIGTGPQARCQIEAHAALLPALSFKVWGRDHAKAKALAAQMASFCQIDAMSDLAAAAAASDVIITATGATQPVLNAAMVHPGTHITAVGADAPGKQELDIALVQKAEVLAVDLVAQCLDHGEVSHAARAGLIKREDVVELGEILSAVHPFRIAQDSITIADLTGIAAQDIAMANAVLSAWKARNGALPPV